jgi:hypothetical protein
LNAHLIGSFRYLRATIAVTGVEQCFSYICRPRKPVFPEKPPICRKLYHKRKSNPTTLIHNNSNYFKIATRFRVRRYGQVGFGSTWSQDHCVLIMSSRIICMNSATYEKRNKATGRGPQLLTQEIFVHQT